MYETQHTFISFYRYLVVGSRTLSGSVSKCTVRESSTSVHRRKETRVISLLNLMSVRYTSSKWQRRKGSVSTEAHDVDEHRNLHVINVKDSLICYASDSRPQE